MLTAAPATPVDPAITALRTQEFARLDRDHLAYLDYTGSALYAERQVRAHQTMLVHGVFGNPHSANEPSHWSGILIDRARADVLRFFDADPASYVVCFTSNASTAAKLIAESYPFSPDSVLALSADNHNSVNGMREFAKRANARVEYLPLDDALRLDDPAARLATFHSRAAKLVAFPAQSNFSGVKHPLALIDAAHGLGYDVLLDAAAFAPSNPLSLRTHAADFVVLSFYKMFGYPTGVGALIARRDALARLRRPWFAGGTVDFVSVQHDLHRLRDLAEGFEDGTPDFLNIAALPAGFELLRELGMERLQAHVERLTDALLRGLRELNATQGHRLVDLYGPRDTRDRGGTVAFNLRTRDGRLVRYGDVERRARDVGVAVRGGCFCNPGAAERAFGMDPQRSRACLDALGRERFSTDRFADCLDDDTPVGAVRASIGLANNLDDIARVLSVVATFAE